jgi:hypothetical protein
VNYLVPGHHRNSFSLSLSSYFRSRIINAVIFSLKKSPGTY